MADSDDEQKFEQVVRRLDPRNKLLRTCQLKGGVSAQVTALEIERPDGTIRKLIVRRHGEIDLSQNPNIAADEYNLLQLVRSAGVSAPMPYAVDQSGAIFPTPYIVVEYIEGATEFAPSDLTDYIAQFAMTLAQIHRVAGSKADLAFLPRQAERYAEKLRNRPARIDDSIGEGRIREVLDAGLPLSQLNDSALLHGDYWPGNLLWEGSKLVAVIDWEDAAVGDPLADLGISRLEILWAFGIEAMFEFTRQYQSMMPTLDFSNLPYWDLYAALRPAFKIA